ncbi:MAG: c-type cytochrome [Betaproteobacteria bacterium]|nr:c-type cytochrome [Betaproteobacteria bacterium]
MQGLFTSSAANRLLLVLLGALAAPNPAAAADGAQVYQVACAVCHTAGVAGAPKLGDRKAWAPLIEEGQAILTAHGYVGVRGMPAKGGKPDLSIEDFAAAVVHLVNASGGKWGQPDAKGLAAIRAEIVKREKELAGAKPK